MISSTACRTLKNCSSHRVSVGIPLHFTANDALCCSLMISWAISQGCLFWFTCCPCCSSSLFTGTILTSFLMVVFLGYHQRKLSSPSFITNVKNLFKWTKIFHKVCDRTFKGCKHLVFKNIQSSTCHLVTARIIKIVQLTYLNTI